VRCGAVRCGAWRGVQRSGEGSAADVRFGHGTLLRAWGAYEVFHVSSPYSISLEGPCRRVVWPELCWEY
jgi:hypothetical protein